MADEATSASTPFHRLHTFPIPLARIVGFAHRNVKEILDATLFSCRIRDEAFDESPRSQAKSSHYRVLTMNRGDLDSPPTRIRFSQLAYGVDVMHEITRGVLSVGHPLSSA